MLVILSQSKAHASADMLVFISGGGLDNIVVLMEGESLFNDATSIVLFEIFFEMVKKIGEGKPGMDGTFAQEGVHIVGQIAWLTAGKLGATCITVHLFLQQFHLHCSSCTDTDSCSQGFCHLTLCNLPF